VQSHAKVAMEAALLVPAALQALICQLLHASTAEATARLAIALPTVFPVTLATICQVVAAQPAVDRSMAALTA
jgi:hypothetical protein